MLSSDEIRKLAGLEPLHRPDDKYLQPRTISFSTQQLREAIAGMAEQQGIELDTRLITDKEMQEIVDQLGTALRESAVELFDERYEEIISEATNSGIGKIRPR